MARILVVEDDKSLQEILKKMLERGGHMVTQADTGRTAIRMLRLEPPDVVLADLVMPDQDGLEVMTMIRREIPKIPVIAMSGGLDHSPLYLQLAKKLGARHVLQKPFTQEQLFAALADVLGADLPRMA